MSKLVFSLIENNGEESTFVDVGAHIGTFTDTMLEYFPNAKGFLFEPTESNYNILKKKFMSNSNITIDNCALDSDKGRKTFFCTNDSAQNSLLNFILGDQNIYPMEVKTNTLDNYFTKLKNLERIDLIKIDTQGNDLNVLKGGINTINKYMPVILTEIIFVPLYKNQANYFEQLEFMDNLGYKIAGIYDVHYHEPGVISYADFLFLPKDKFEKLSTGISTFANFVCYDVDTVINENKKLKAICQERLDLINNLSEEAGKRLDIINSLTQEIKRLQGQ